MARTLKVIVEQHSGADKPTSWNDLTDKPFDDISEDRLLVSHELEFEFNSYAGNYVSTTSYQSDGALIENGKTYVVKWDGETYKFTHGSDYPDIGNKHLGNSSADDTGEPWAYFGSSGGFYWSPTGGAHTFELYEHVEEIVRLDEKFMPILTASNGKRYKLVAADNGTLQLSQVE